MKTKFVAATAAILAGATLLLGATPAMAHDRIGFGISVGLPVAPIAYVGPAPVYAPAPAPVVYGGYGPVVRVAAPYYYGRGWGYDHRFYADHGYHGYERGGRVGGWHR